jgi:serine/tyrosine/threonine adenylyltransferase
MNIHITTSFTNSLPADEHTNNETRQVFGACYSSVNPRIPSQPKLVHVADEVRKELGISEEKIQSQDFLEIFSGRKIYPNTQPFAMNYAGHQFGSWAGQLGDGRAIVLFELLHQNQSFTLQLKGAGKTPYSRRGDGLAVLRSSIREHLCSEAMFHLGVPTTRSLCLLETGDKVLRDMLYDGNSEYEKGAIVCRVAPSFIRFGSFEIHAARNEFEILKQLADYTIEKHFPEINSKGKTKYIDFFSRVAQTTRKLMIEWQRVGFVHGVMNTDNMSIHGITIDFGPYGWLEDYNPDWTPNTTDSQHHRYAYGNQPEIALWNLYQLANALYPLIEEAKPLEAILSEYSEQFDIEFLQMMREKLGLYDNENSLILVNEVLQHLQLVETDYTIFFRNLSKVKKTDSPETVFEKLQFAFYLPEKIDGTTQKTWFFWITQYLNCLQKETFTDDERALKMNKVNPKYVLRNYMAQLAIDQANEDDYSLINELYELLKKPYDEQPEMEKWFAKRPDWARQKVGCSMLSCSS